MDNSIPDNSSLPEQNIALTITDLINDAGATALNPDFAWSIERT